MGFSFTYSRKTETRETAQRYTDTQNEMRKPEWNCMCSHWMRWIAFVSLHRTVMPTYASCFNDATCVGVCVCLLCSLLFFPCESIFAKLFIISLYTNHHHHHHHHSGSPVTAMNEDTRRTGRMQSKLIWILSSFSMSVSISSFSIHLRVAPCLSLLQFWVP